MECVSVIHSSIHQDLPVLRYTDKQTYTGDYPLTAHNVLTSFVRRRIRKKNISANQYGQILDNDLLRLEICGASDREGIWRWAAAGG